MASELFVNNFAVQLAAGCAPTDTSLTLASAVPAPLQAIGGQWRALITDSFGSEYVIVPGGQAGPTVTGVTRGAEGTAATSHSQGAWVTHALTAGAIANATGGGTAPTVQGTAGTNLGATQTLNFGNAATELWLVGTLNANLTVTTSNRAAGSRAVMMLTQDGTGGRTLTVSDGTNSVVVTIASAASAVTVVEIKCPDASTTDVAVDGGGGTGTSNNANRFGDGSDGAVTFDGVTAVTGFTLAGSTYTQTRDTFFASATVNSGVTLDNAGYSIWCTGTFTINSGGTFGIAGAAGAANGTASNTTVNSIASGIGAGAGNTGAGSAGSKGLVGSAGGGGTGTGGAGGASQAAFITSSTVMKSTFANPARSLMPQVIVGSITLRTVSGGSGGSGGGGDTTNKGGGGGNGGPYLLVFAKTWVNNGAVVASGGAGGTPATGNCGGGGGGGGGLVLVYTQAASGSGTVTVAGGAAGSGVGTGTAGGSGSAGLSLVQTLV